MSRSSDSLLGSQAYKWRSYSSGSQRCDPLTSGVKYNLATGMENICSQTEKFLPELKQTSKKKKRLVSKTGELQVVSKNVANRTKLYIADVFTTMIDWHWKWVFLLFLVSYVLTWSVFATVWWFIILVRGNGVCLEKVDGWTSAFLFSLETQQTIGYGSRSIATKCAEAIIVLQIQTIVGIVVDAFMLGLTFAKLSRPRERALTCSFSKNAVITLRNGKMCLMFRVADIRKSQIVEAHIRLQLFREVKTAEGHNYPFYQEDLKVCYNPDDYKQQNEDNRNHIFLLFPLVIVHVIDEASPFYELTPEKLKESHFELVAVLDGIVEATGMNTQPKTSYLPDEILWGYNFVNLTDRSYNDNRGFYWWDYSRLDDVYKVAVTPLCSPKEYYQQHGFPSENESSMNYL